MPFAWDQRKARSNQAKHGVAFEKAQFAFDDPFAVVAIDVKHSTSDERRQWLIGDCGTALIVVVFTERGTNEFRIISARNAGRRDRRKYAAHKRNTFSVESRPAGDG